MYVERLNYIFTHARSPENYTIHALSQEVTGNVLPQEKEEAKTDAIQYK